MWVTPRQRPKVSARAMRPFSGSDRLPRPRGEIERAFEHLQRHGVVLHRAGPIAIRFERLHAGASVVGPIPIVYLEVQDVARDDAEEQATIVQTDAAEHRSRRDVAKLFELIEDVRSKRLGPLQ